MRMSGFDFYEREDSPGSEFLAPIWRPNIFRCIDLFGPVRCMFESNFSVDTGMARYGALWNTFKRVTSAFGEADCRAPFSAKVATIYALA